LANQHTLAKEFNSVRINIDSDDSDQSDSEIIEDGYVLTDTFNFDDLNKKDLEEIYTYVRYTLIPKNEELQSIPIDVHKFNKLVNYILPACEEQRMLGKLLSINKGLNTDDYGEYKYIMDVQS